MTLDLWVEASRDREAEISSLRMAQAKVAVAGLWPFLALAQSEREFEHRLALAWEHIAREVPNDLLQPVAESLHADFTVSRQAVVDEHRTGAKNAQGDEVEDGEQPEGGDMPDWLQTKIHGEGSRTVEFFHRASGRWVTAALEEEEGGGNPYYFSGGPEGGPATGDTHQFPPHPTGGDPIDPLNQMFPMQPSPWTVPPGGEWKEAPMNLGPNQPGQHHAAAVGEKAACTECGGQIVYSKHDHGKEWNHVGSNSWLLDDAHVPAPVRKRAAGNPNYFAGGPEGVAGTPEGGFPEDVAQGVDPEDPINELYGVTPISASLGNGRARVANTPHNPAPDSDKLLGTDFDSPEEAERWGKAERGEQQSSRDSTALTGSRHQGFFDPADPSVRMVAADDPFSQSGNPFSMGPSPQAPAGATNAGGDANVPTPTATPATTSPRQLPGGAGAGGAGGGDPGDSSDRAAKNQAVGHRVHGESRELQTDDDPTGYGDEYEHNIYERGGPLSTRPRQDPGARSINTPQIQRQPIPTNSSSHPGGGARQGEEGDEDDRRQASRVAELLVRELVA
jgi:hypothetical protein